MKTFTQLSACVVLASTLFASCSRPVATYQKMPVERFTAAPAVATTPPVLTAPEATVSPAPQPAEAVKQAEKTFNEAVASARREGRLTDSKKMDKRIARVQSLLAEAGTKTAAASQTVTTPKKMTFAERMMLKKMDKKIQKSLAPKDTTATNAVTGLTRLGIIIAIVGLILIFIPGLGWLGSIGVIVGLVLILLDLLDVA